MTNIVEQTTKLPLQLLKEIIDPVQKVLSSTSLISGPDTMEAGTDREQKKDNATDLPRGQRIQSKGYIKYPVYDFF